MVDAREIAEYAREKLKSDSTLDKVELLAALIAHFASDLPWSVAVTVVSIAVQVVRDLTDDEVEPESLEAGHRDTLSEIFDSGPNAPEGALSAAALLAEHRKMVVKRVDAWVGDKVLDKEELKEIYWDYVRLAADEKLWSAAEYVPQVLVDLGIILSLHAIYGREI